MRRRAAFLWRLAPSSLGYSAFWLPHNKRLSFTVKLARFIQPQPHQACRCIDEISSPLIVNNISLRIIIK